MARRGPQTFTQWFLERSWEYFCRKLKWLEAAHPTPAAGYFQL